MCLHMYIPATSYIVVILLSTTMSAHWQGQPTPIFIYTKANVNWTGYMTT